MFPWTASTMGSVIGALSWFLTRSLHGLCSFVGEALLLITETGISSV